MDRRKFIGTCFCVALASSCAPFIMRNNDNGDIKWTPEEYNEMMDNIHDDIVSHMDIHLAEHCNLGCKACLHYSCIAEKEFYLLNKFEKDMARMSHVFNKKLYRMDLLGGEPLLNPDINEYFKISRKFFPKTRIELVTNAVLLDDMDESFWKTMHKYDIKLVPSIYPIKINWESIVNKAKKYDVDMFFAYTNRFTKFSLDKIKENQMNVFHITRLNKNGHKDFDYKNCFLINKCTSMYDGKLYPCPTIAYIRHLNKKFGTDFQQTKDDFLDLYEATNVKDVADFLRKQHPFCKYCYPFKDPIKWETLKEHTIDEWT